MTLTEEQQTLLDKWFKLRFPSERMGNEYYKTWQRRFEEWDPTLYMDSGSAKLWWEVRNE